MDIDDIISELIADGGLPCETIRYCLDHPDEVVPTFIAILSRAASDHSVTPDESDSLFLIVHILGELREQQAYRPLVELLRQDRQTLDELFGDAITETMPQIMISLFDGDPEPLYGLIEDAEADEFAREVALVAWTRWAYDGGISTEDAQSRLMGWFETLQPQKDSNVWSAWIDAVAALRLTALNEAVREVITRGRLPPRTMFYSDYERLLRTSQEEPEEFLQWRRLFAFTDTVGTLSKWHGFSEAYLREQRQVERMPFPSETLTNPLRHIGRNDPCPCGSGVKFKKCCLH